MRRAAKSTRWMKKLKLAALLLGLLEVGLTTPLAAQPLATEYRRRVVGEEITATWCGFCPRGMVGIEKLKAKYPGTFISIAVHSNDVMAEPAYDKALSEKLPSLPKILIDRRLKGDPYVDLEKLYLEALTIPAPATVTVSAAFADAARTRFEADIQTRFAHASDGRQYAYALVLIEKEVQGNSSRYNQANSYAGAAWPMGGYELLPVQIPGAQMKYLDVARAIFDDFNGIPGSVPRQFAAGEVLSFHYEADLPENVGQKNNLAIAALLIDRSTGAVGNAAVTELAAEAPTANTAVESAPSSPAAFCFVAGRLQMQPLANGEALGIEVYDLTGRRAAFFRTESPAPTTFDKVFPPGLYTLRVSNGHAIYTEKIRNR